MSSSCADDCTAHTLRCFGAHASLLMLVMLHRNYQMEMHVMIMLSKQGLLLFWFLIREQIGSGLSDLCLAENQASQWSVMLLCQICHLHCYMALWPSISWTCMHTLACTSSSHTSYALLIISYSYALLTSHMHYLSSHTSYALGNSSLYNTSPQQHIHIYVVGEPQFAEAKGSTLLASACHWTGVFDVGLMLGSISLVLSSAGVMCWHK
jgi:hypothetical protein